MLYDLEANILCWELAKDSIYTTKEFGNFIIHLSKVGKPVLIEVLDASKFIGQFNSLQKKGLEPIPPISMV